MKQRIYFHVIEEGHEIGWQGCYDTKDEAKKAVEHLQNTFDDLFFYVWESESESMPVIVTV